MSDGECPAVEQPESPEAPAVPDRILAKAQNLQLLPPDDSVLATGKLTDRTLYIASL